MPQRPALPAGERSATPCRAFMVGGAACLVLAGFGPSMLLGPLFLLVGLGCLGATVVGIRRNEVPARRRPWWVIFAAMATFLAGNIMRMVMAGPDGAAPASGGYLPDVLAVPGYLLLGYGFLDMLRRRRAADDDPALTDALMVGLAAALTVWVLAVEPRVGAGGPVTAPQLAAAFFLVADVLLLVFVAFLMFADGARRPTLWLIGIASIAMFAGDMTYAMRELGLGRDGPPQRAMDLLFLVAYLGVAAATLHPTMRTLTEPQSVVIHNLGTLRIVGIAAVLLTPTALTIAWPPATVSGGLIRIGLSALLTVTTVLRIVRANDSRARAEQAARRRATHDRLTDLPNRELLAETITQWCDRATDDGLDISLLFLDLDRFKMVNDSWGHDVGDELLCAVAGRLSAAVRSEDLVCRIGGDEFVIALATGSPAALAESLAKRLLVDFAQPFELSVGEVVITPSIGVARSSGAVEALELIRDADTAMYNAKESGRNGYAFFDGSLRDQVRVRVDLEQALRGALQRGELSVHYQPIVDLAAGELSGFEALMRWNHPQLGSVSPLEFIPIAEDTGLIVASGAWLLEEAAAELVGWCAQRPADLPELHMSVNISVRQLRDCALVDVVQGVLDRTGLPASALWLEITESGVMDNLEAALTTLWRLRAMGVTLCIDDFGTGYSSLSYLRRLPTGIVKIDRSFVAGVGEDSTNEPIVRAVLAMAHALGQQVVAEGVETMVQRDWLREQGCDLAQGWLYGAPRPAAAQFAWMDRAVVADAPNAAV